MRAAMRGPCSGSLSGSWRSPSSDSQVLSDEPHPSKKRRAVSRLATGSSVANSRSSGNVISRARASISAWAANVSVNHRARASPKMSGSVSWACAATLLVVICAPVRPDGRPSDGKSLEATSPANFLIRRLQGEAEVRLRERQRLPRTDAREQPLQRHDGAKAVGKEEPGQPLGLRVEHRVQLAKVVEVLLKREHMTPRSLGAPMAAQIKADAREAALRPQGHRRRVTLAVFGVAVHDADGGLRRGPRDGVAQLGPRGTGSFPSSALECAHGGAARCAPSP